MEWLQIAEEKCIREFEEEQELETEYDDDDKEDNDRNTDEINKNHCKNIMPIQANIAYAKMEDVRL